VMFAFWSEGFDAAASLAREDMVDQGESGRPSTGLWVSVYLPLPSIGRPALSFLFFTLRPTMAFFTRPQSASAAVKIVAPNAISEDPIKTSPKKGTICSVNYPSSWP
jgi:hypothetical protein